MTRTKKTVLKLLVDAMVIGAATATLMVAANQAVRTRVEAATARLERDYQLESCKGKIEVVTSGGGRIDCVEGRYAVEYDFAKKWAESIGQALFYAQQTGLRPGVALIIEKPSECRFLTRWRAATKAARRSIRLQLVGPAAGACS